MLQQAIIWGVGTRDPSGCRVALAPGVLPDFFTLIYNSLFWAF